MFELMIATASGEIAAGAGWAVVGASLAAGLAALGAGIGLSKIAQGRAEAIARQPEAAGDISGGSLLLGFLLEGVALFACVIAILGVTGATDAFNPENPGYHTDEAPEASAPAESDVEAPMVRYEED